MALPVELHLERHLEEHPAQGVRTGKVSSNRLVGSAESNQALTCDLGAIDQGHHVDRVGCSP